MNIRTNIFTKRVVRHWSRLSRETAGSQFLEKFRNVFVRHLRTWFSGGLGSAGLLLDSIILKSFCNLK